MSLHETLEKARAKSGKTIRQIGEEVGRSHSNVSRWITGTQVPDEEVLSALARSLRIPVAQLRKEHAEATRVSLTERVAVLEAKVDRLIELLERPVMIDGDPRAAVRS